MLISLRFRNFRSFKDEAELSLSAYDADKTHEAALIAPPGGSRSTLRLLPAIAIYGANAAGKTNVLTALSEVKHAVLASQIKWAPDRPILIDAFAGGGVDDVTSMEVQMFVRDERFRYGFSCDQTSFREEWLYSYPKGRERFLFSRTTDDNGSVNIRTGEYFGGEKSYIDGTKSRTRHNSLFISASAQDNHPISISIYNFFNDIVMSTLTHEQDEIRSTLTSSFLETGGSFKHALLQLLRTADPAIADVAVKAREGQGWNDYMKAGQTDRFFTGEPRYDVFFHMKDDTGKFTLPFHEQSKGVRRMYALTGEIYGVISSGDVLIVDEIESSIHPHLARMIVDMFQNREINRHGSQVIFTTHDTNLLDQSLLRRDQIWFVEKQGCGSHLYSLLEFSPRKDSNLELGYLRGKYGAVPVARPPTNWSRISAEDVDQQPAAAPSA